MVVSTNTNDALGQSRIRERLEIAPGETVIVAPGRVHRTSGHRFAVWAASILKMAEVSVHLIIPEGSYGQHTGQYARNVVEFARMTGFAEKVTLAGPEWSTSDLLSAADIAIFLDTDDTPGSLLSEAISDGLPVIVCDTPETRNRYANEKNVLLVRHDKPREIARALMKIIEDKTPSE